MAKKSVILRNKTREKMSAQYREKRSALRKIVKSATASLEEKRDAQAKLQKMPRDTSPIRFKVRCQLSGRPRGVYRSFRLSRILLRQLAHQGLIPGMKKASW